MPVWMYRLIALCSTRARNTSICKKILFEKLDQFDQLSDVLALFSFQQANGKLMGSKGIGRELYEISAAVDRARNEVVDRLQLSGKILIQGEAKQLNRFSLAVHGNAVLIPAAYTISQQGRIDPNVEAFALLDRQLVAYMDQIAGGVTPKEFGGERTTASEVNLFAAREEEKRDAILERFLLQVGKMIGTCQRRIADPKIDDPEAREAREYLLNYLSQEELTYLAAQPALRTVDDLTDLKAQQLVLFANEKRTDPLFDQAKLQKAAASARIDAEFAEDVLLPDPDPTVLAEQSRAQELETLLLTTGREVPVSPRDNHRVHIETLKATIAAAAEQIGSGDPALMAAFQAMLGHWAQHIEVAVAAGAKKDEFAEDLRQIKEAATQLGQLQATLAAQQQQNAAMAQQGIPPEAIAAQAQIAANSSPPPTNV